MTKKRRWLIRLLALVFCLGLIVPLPVSAADLYFTSINDTVLPLTADSMPVWSGNTLYVPYTIFDSNTTGIKLGMDTSYSRTENKVTLYNTQQFLRFDLNAGTCWNDITGESYNARAIIRNGRPYLPLKTVCYFFGLNYSYTSIRQGYLVRIKSDAVVLSDADFIDAAEDLINRRLREYNQSLNPAPSTGSSGAVTPSPTPPDVNSSGDPTEIRTYLAFRCTDGEGIASILDTLDNSREYALFLCTPQLLKEESDLVRRILGTGHSIGLLAEGTDLEQTRALLEEGSRLLEQSFHTRTTLVYVPKDQRAALEDEGWICWNETLALAPSETAGPNTFASNTLGRLNGRTKSTYLTLEGNGNTGRILSILLQQLQNNHFVISIPMETRI